MLARWRSFFERRISLATILILLATAQRTARAQSVNGAISVSATIMPPIPTHALRLIAFRVERDGIGRLETAAPVAGSVSQIVMWTVSSSANGFAPVEQAPMLIEAAPHGVSPAIGTLSGRTSMVRVHCEVDLGATDGAPPGSTSREVTVRISYLIVPGT